MKNTIIAAAAFSLLAAITHKPAKAQHAISFDIAAVRNIHNQLNGLNLSSFYHFTEHITGGIEVNRFFASKQMKGDEAVHLSAWDIDLNFHYLVPLNKHWSIYPVAGVSHTSEKEILEAEYLENFTERFWSYNTGAGLIWHKGKWAPHAEYLFTRGHLNQQFLLAGFSYEMEWKHPHQKQPNKK